MLVRENRRWIGSSLDGGKAVRIGYLVIPVRIRGRRFSVTQASRRVVLISRTGRRSEFGTSAFLDRSICADAPEATHCTTDGKRSQPVTWDKRSTSPLFDSSRG